MKERPILFAAPLVRALLAGTKTQTRRIVKPRLAAELTAEGWPNVPPLCIASVAEACPYGAPGDRLWVRESFHHSDDHPIGDEQCSAGYCVEYSADECKRGEPGHRCEHRHGRGRPSIHMPRWASRLTLEVTGIRVERLQAITEEDARAEGVEPFREDPDGNAGTCRDAFHVLWDEINGERAAWESNPWVWAVEFRRLP